MAVWIPIQFINASTSCQRQPRTQVRHGGSPESLYYAGQLSTGPGTRDEEPRLRQSTDAAAAGPGGLRSPSRRLWAGHSEPLRVTPSHTIQYFRPCSAAGNRVTSGPGSVRY
jgi:hypothetical protein